MTKSTKVSKPIIESKSRQVFRSNNEWLNTHIQLVDAALVNAIRTLKVYPKKQDSIAFALSPAEAEKYTSLNHPVKQYIPILSQSQNRTIEFAICQIYRHFIMYLRSIIHEMYKHNPLQVVQELCTENVTKSISFFEIINLGSYDKVETYVVDSVFRGLEDMRSTPKLLSKILKCAGINGSVAKGEINAAMKYIELRHLFVHHQGKYDKKYIKSYGTMYSPAIIEGAKIAATYSLFKDAQDAIDKLCSKIDSSLIAANVISQR